MLRTAHVVTLTSLRDAYGVDRQAATVAPPAWNAGFSRHVRERTPPDQLQALILDLCLAREWTTAKQLARWFSMHRPGLVQRHIGPLVDDEFLLLRFPDKVRSRNQAYRTNPDKWPPRR